MGLSAAAWTRTSTSPCLGCGVGRSPYLSTSGPPVDSRYAAFIVGVSPGQVARTAYASREPVASGGERRTREGDMAATVTEAILNDPVTRHMRRDFIQLRADQTVAQTLTAVREGQAPGR